MRHVTFVAPGKLTWEDAPNPTLRGPLEALVRPTVVGRCDLDVLPLARGESIGHEIIGEIVELGDEAAKRFSVGQSVLVAAQISCGVCRMCVAGETGRCAQVPLGASYGMGRAGGFGGGLAELIRVPFASGMLTPIPQNADHAAMIGLADMASDAWRAVGPQLLARPGGSVLVLGGATPVIGVYAAGLARSLGAGRVVYVDADSGRRAVAAAYGAETAEHIDGVANAVFDIAVDAASDTQALLAAIRACGPAAQLTSVAPPFVSPELPLLEMYYKGLTYIIGRPNCRHGHAPALDAWSAHGFRPELAGPKIFKFDDAIEAWLDSSLYVAVTNA